MIDAALVGTWAGTNGFRLMPGDPLRTFPATARVATAAGGHLVVVAYTWRHPDDGPQDGLFLVGRGGDGGAVTATWADSWHQKPEPMSLTGRAAQALDLEGVYGGDWRWRIRVEQEEGGQLLVTMDNVVPVGEATQDVPPGPYPVMVLRAVRS